MSDMNFNDRPGRVGTTSQMERPPEGSSGGAKDQAAQAASTAADEGKHVTAVAGGEAQKVAGEAKQQGKALLDDAKGQLQEQTKVQHERVVQTLSSLGDDLQQMSSQSDSGLASDIVQQAAQRVRGISDHLQRREPAELLDDVRDFARRKPGTFLLGALAAGVVAGRFARGAQKAASSGSTGSTDSLGTGASSTGSLSGGTLAGGGSVTGAPLQQSSLDENTQLMDTPRTTPSAPAMATFPPDQPGEIR